MNCQKNHCIEIENFCKNNFSREIVLICGRVKNQCGHECIELLRKDRECRTSGILFNKAFKFLLKLDENQANVIKIKYCWEEIELVINHKRIDPILFDIQPLYIIPRGHDGSFQSITGDDDDDSESSVNSALMKIDLLTALAQCLISSKVCDDNVDDGGRKVVDFVLNRCAIFNSSLSVEEVWRLNQFELYDAIAQEIVDRFGAGIVQRRKFIGFISCTKFLGLSEGEECNYANIQSKTLANPSLGCGFLALLGNGCFYALPNSVSEVIDAFRSKKIVDTRFLLDDSNYRKSYGGCFSTTLGALIHEVGHTFELGHTENGLMGNDIDHVHRFFLCENFTEIMPKRNVSNCQQLMNGGEKRPIVRKFTKISRNGAYLEKYREQKDNDLTFFERNCQLILMNHCWFTQKVANDSLAFDDYEKSIYSQNDSSIMLVEIRELTSKNSLIKIFWDLSGRSVKKFKIDFNLTDCALFAIASDGSMLKKTFSTA